MSIVLLDQPPPADLAARLAEFEAQFTYPLGEGRAFRISHGSDYSRFFRSMGRAACFIEQDGGRVVGALACVIRRLSLPHGGECEAAYLADLKVVPGKDSGWTLVRLASAAREWGVRFTDKAFAVVMEGTRVTPDRYTGRVGIPRFEPVDRIAILRVPTGRSVDAAPGVNAAAAPAAGAGATAGRFVDDPDQVERCWRALAAGAWHASGGAPAERSEMPPAWFASAAGAACGRLEDTRRAKRLITLDGDEMVSAHLTGFAFRSAEAGAGLIREACRRSAQRGYPALFVAVADGEAAAVRERLGDRDITVAPARVYASALESGAPWIVNTSEI